MLHPTKLDDVGPTCWLRSNRPLRRTHCVTRQVASIVTEQATKSRHKMEYLHSVGRAVFIGLLLRFPGIFVIVEISVHIFFMYK